MHKTSTTGSIFQTSVSALMPVVILLLCVLDTRVDAQWSASSAAHPLDRQVVSFSADREELTEVLGRISTSYRIPMGCEIAIKDMHKHAPRKFTFSLSNTTVRSILEEIAVQDPDYYWKDEGGVIVFRPRDGKADTLVAGFLSTKIAHLKVNEKRISVYGPSQDRNNAGGHKTILQHMALATIKSSLVRYPRGSGLVLSACI